MHPTLRSSDGFLLLLLDANRNKSKFSGKLQFLKIISFLPFQVSNSSCPLFPLNCWISAAEIRNDFQLSCRVSHYYHNNLLLVSLEKILISLLSSARTYTSHNCLLLHPTGTSGISDCFRGFRGKILTEYYSGGLRENMS